MQPSDNRLPRNIVPSDAERQEAGSSSNAGTGGDGVMMRLIVFLVTCHDGVRPTFLPSFHRHYREYIDSFVPLHAIFMSHVR